jgi:hypothetical protein
MTAADSTRRQRRALDVVEALVLPALAEIDPSSMAEHLAAVEERLLLEINVLDVDERADVLRVLVAIVAMQALDMCATLRAISGILAADAPGTIDPARIVTTTVNRLRGHLPIEPDEEHP